MSDLINNPAHYKQCSDIGRRILTAAKLNQDNAQLDSGHHRMITGTKLNLDGECIDAVESSDYFQNSHAFSVLKYVWHAGNKGYAKRDLGKAQWYANRYLNFYRPDPLMLALRDAIVAELMAIG